MLQDEFPTTFLHADTHSGTGGDPFDFPEGLARMSWYAVSGVPDVRMDGKYATVGAGSCVGAYTEYHADYLTRMAETGGVSPVQVTGSYVVDGGLLTVNALYALVDPVPQTGVQATIFITEDDVYYNASTSFDHLSRRLYNQGVTLNNVGDQIAVTNVFTVDAAWNLDKIHVICILQKTGGTKEIIQAAELPYLPDYQVTFPLPVRSVPNGNGDALFPGSVKNVSDGADVLTLSMDTGFGWPAAFQVGDDPTWYTAPQTVSLAPGDSVAITVKVTTDAVKRTGAGNLTCQSLVTGRLGPFRLQVYNMAYSIFFVDDDGSRFDETPFLTAFDGLGYLYENWDVYHSHGNAAPTAKNLAGFDVVVWQTGYQGTAMGTDDQTTLMTYLDAGGNLYLNNMDLMSTVYPPSTFAVDYLGVASRAVNTKAHTAVGVAGDPITSGMSIPLTFLSEGLNKVDTVLPTATAHSIFFSEQDSSNALANELGRGSRVVFNTIVQSAFSTSGAAPNNNQTVIEKTIFWLTGQQVVAVPDGPVAASRLTVVPNPFAGSADLSFSLSPRASAGAVRLTMVDVAGRQVRTLVDGRMNPGMQLLRWNGTDNLGRALPSGIYFGKLQTVEGTKTQKVILAR
jgi:hypothetical protein